MATGSKHFSFATARMCDFRYTNIPTFGRPGRAGCRHKGKTVRAAAAGLHQYTNIPTSAEEAKIYTKYTVKNQYTIYQLFPRPRTSYNSHKAKLRKARSALGIYRQGILVYNNILYTNFSAAGRPPNNRFKGNPLVSFLNRFLRLKPQLVYWLHTNIPN